MDDFFERVYEVTRKIPFGRVATYGAIAKYLEKPHGARMVGWALNKAGSQSEFVPAHRVVNRKGVLTGKNHFGDNTIMRQMLENEGIVVDDDQIQNLEDVLWYPYKELV